MVKPRLVTAADYALNDTYYIPVNYTTVCRKKATKLRLNTHFYAIRRMTLALIIKLQAAAVWVKAVLTSLIFILHIMSHVNHANFYTIMFRSVR